MPDPPGHELSGDGLDVSMAIGLPSRENVLNPNQELTRDRHDRFVVPDPLGEPTKCHLPSQGGTAMGRPRKTWMPKTTATTRHIKRVVGYVRVSTSEQAATGYGLDAQRVAIADYCRAAGYELVAVHADEGLSGTLPPTERPALAELLDRVKSGLVDAVIVKASDRIGRRVTVAMAVYEALDAAGVAFITITEPGLSSALLRAIFARIAEEERARIRERTSGGRKVKAESGGYAGGKVPFGYRLEGARKTARWEVDDAAAAIVRRSFARRVAGATFAAIADELNAEGIASPQGTSWGARTVWTIANNPAYTGVRRWREGTEYLAEGEYAPIIDASTFRGGQPKVA
jgi:site-specific DNA recombinase